MYKIIGANGIFHKFAEIFQNVLNGHANLKKIEMKTKKEHKNWLSKELRSLINEKHRVFNEWKKDTNQELSNSYKVLRNNVNRKLRKASDDYTKQFFEIIAPKLPSFIFKGNEFNFRPVTSRELYKVFETTNTKISWTRVYTILGTERLYVAHWNQFTICY